MNSSKFNKGPNFRSPRSFLDSEETQLNLEGWSLFILKYDWCLRKNIYNLITNKYFDGGIIFLILFSSVILVLDDPLQDPTS
jgi:hypothetical protein